MALEAKDENEYSFFADKEWRCFGARWALSVGCVEKLGKIWKFFLLSELAHEEAASGATLGLCLGGKDDMEIDGAIGAEGWRACLGLEKKINLIVNPFGVLVFYFLFYFLFFLLKQIHGKLSG